MAGTTTKKITVYINGKEIQNNLKDIQSEIVKVRNEMRKCTIGTEEYEEKAMELRKLNKIVEEHRNELKGVGKDWKDIIHTLGNIGNIMSGVRSFGYIMEGMADSVITTTEEFAKMDDAYGRVRKTTGLTREDVERLNESFMKMDTRTSREQLNELAYEAGKLGINTREGVEQFVRASDVINVALGDVLGDKAMITIAKLTDVYKDVTTQLQDTTLEERMRKIADAVNELGKRSTANEEYIIDFTARLAGVANQAGLSADQVMGFASALDQDMQRVEMSSTAFQKLIVQMFRKPKKFARMAGQSVKEFSELVKTDMNGALMAVLKNMKSDEGLEALVPILDDVKLAGQRATTVIADIANNLSKVAEAQGIANEQLEVGGSAQAEFNKMQATAQAEMEKFRKKVLDAKIALGQELMPVSIELLNLGGNAIKVTTSLTTALLKNLDIIGMLAGAVALYNMKKIASATATLAATAAEKAENAILFLMPRRYVTARLAQEEATRAKYANAAATKFALAEQIKENAAKLTGTARTLELAKADRTLAAAKTLEANASKAATTAMKLEKAAMATTPWGLALAGVTALTAGIVALVRARNRNIEALRQERAELIKNANQMSVRELQDKIEELNKQIKEKEKAKAKRDENQAQLDEQYQFRKGESPATRNAKASRELWAEIIQLQTIRTRLQGEIDRKLKEAESPLVFDSQEGGTPYTPSGKDDKSDPWASLVERVTSYVEKANTKVKDGLAETMSAVTDEYKKLERAIENANTATKPTGVTKEGLREQLKDAKDIMQQAKLDDYLKKVNTQLEGFQKGLKEVDDNEYLQKIARAQEEYNKKLADFKETMEVLKGSLRVEGLTAEQIEAIGEKMVELQELIDKLESIGISATTNTIKANDVRMVKRSSRLGGLETIRQKYTDTVEDATNKRDEALADANNRLEAAKAIEDYDLVEKIQEEIKTLNDNLDTTEKNAKDLMKVEVWDHWISQIEQFSNAILDIFGNISTLLSNMEETELQKEEKRRDDSLAQLEKQYQAGTLSKEQYEKRKNIIEEKYDEKHKEIQLKQWKREKALNIAQASIDGIVAVLKTYKSYGGWTPAAIAMAALMSASSAAQIAAIAATPKPYAKGGYANEKTIMVGEAGGEWVASNRLLSDKSTAPMIAALDAYQKGDKTALQRVGMATPAWGDVRRASERIGGKRDEDSIAELVRLMKSGGINAVISRRYMEDYEKNENFLRSRSRW